MRVKLSVLVIALLLLTSVPILAQQSPTKTFTTDDTSFSFTYPSSWGIEANNAKQGMNAFVTITNTAQDTDVASMDTVLMQVFLPLRSYQVALNGSKTPEEALVQALNISYGVFPAFNSATLAGVQQSLKTAIPTPDVAEFTVNGRSAAYGYVKMQTWGIDTSQLGILADLGNDYWVSTWVRAPKGGLPALQKNEATILAIVKSMRYMPTTPPTINNPDLPQVYWGLLGMQEHGYIKFNYPKDWHVSTSLFGVIAISNKTGDLLNIETSPQSGQFIAIIQGMSDTWGLPDSAGLVNDCNSSKSDLTAKTLIARFLAVLTPDQLDQIKQRGATLTQPEITAINGKEIVYLRVYQNDIEALQIFIPFGGRSIPSITITAEKGEMAQFEKQLFAVAGTFEYTLKPCNQTVTPEATSPS